MVFMDDVEEMGFSVGDCNLCPHRRTKKEIEESGIPFSEWTCKFLSYPCEEEGIEVVEPPY